MADDLAELAASFRRALGADGRAPRTVTLYLMAVRFFGLWLTERGRPATLEELARNNIREWLADLTDRGQAAGTVKMRHRGLFRFCGWLVAEDELSANRWWA